MKNECTCLSGQGTVGESCEGKLDADKKWQPVDDCLACKEGFLLKKVEGTEEDLMKCVPAPAGTEKEEKEGAAERRRKKSRGTRGGAGEAGEKERQANTGCVFLPSAKLPRKFFANVGAVVEKGRQVCIRCGLGGVGRG